MKYIFKDSLTREKWVILILLGLCLAAYSAGLFGGFVYDDKYLIVNNPYIKGPGLTMLNLSHSIYEPTCEFYKTDYYRPAQALSYALDYRIWKLNPFGYRLSNIILHFLNSLLVFLFIKAVFANRIGALLTAAIFCVHPVNTSVVAYISGRADLLSGFFILISLLTVTQLLKTGRNTPGMLILAASFILALFSRESALLLTIGVLPLFLVLPGKAKNTKFIILVLFAAIASAYLMFRAYFLHMPVIKYLPNERNLFIMAVNFFQLLMYQLYFLIFPSGLHFMHTIKPLTLISDPRFLISAAFAALLFLALWRKRKEKIFIFGLFWFVIFMFQAFFVMAKFVKGRVSVGEHWVYLASIGLFAVFAGYLTARLAPKNKKMFIAVSAIILLSCIITTARYSLNFRDDYTLSKSILKYEPDSLEAHKSLINFYMEKALYDDALIYISRASEIGPDDPDIYFLRGRYYDLKDERGQALKIYHELLTLKPDSARTCNNVGAIYFDTGDYAAAEKYFRKAMILNPYLYEASLNMAKLYVLKGKTEEGGDYYRQALAVNPDSHEALTSLARLSLEDGDFKAAVYFYKKAIAINAVDAPTLVSLAVAYAGSGMAAESRRCLERALKINPLSEDALLNLGVFYANHNDFDKAISLWRRVIRLNPGNTVAAGYIEKAEGLKKGKSKR